jgi:hypothetical protein
MLGETGERMMVALALLSEQRATTRRRLQMPPAFHQFHPE